jgi:hypothetical protein
MTIYPNPYYEELANRIGIYKFTKNGPFASKQGTLIGEKQGYIISVGTHTSDRKGGIGILIHFKKNENFEMIRAAVQFSPALLSALKIKELSDKYRKEFQIGEDSFFWAWPYVFKKPSIDLIAEMVESFLAAIRQTAAGFQGRCELCETNSVSGITLFNRAPVYYCEGCQQKVKEELGIAESAYEEQPSNVLLGTLYGAAGAIAGGVAWGYITFYSNHIYAAAAIGIGFLVAWLTRKGIGKVTVQSRILVGVLTLASVFLGDFLYVVLSVMKENNAPFSSDLFFDLFSHIVEIEFRGDNIPTLLFALLGAYYATRILSKPNFKAQFERLE